MVLDPFTYSWEAPEAYLRVSPWSYAKDISTTNRKAGQGTSRVNDVPRRFN
jgi:hypothetical protein